MQRNGDGQCVIKRQTIDQIVNVASWSNNLEIEPYQEGAREKNKVNCPIEPPFSFLIPGHLYLFKQSSHRYPAQFWVEVIAFRLGLFMGVAVPPAFVSIDENRQIAGALIEWFHNYPQGIREEYIPGGELFVKVNSAYDRKKGEEHNIKDLITIITEKDDLLKVWQEHWAKIFCFDTIIGNTDRHQDNWGLICSGGNNYFSPAFDNGTAMGHEILEKDLTKKLKSLEKYVLHNKARHHMKWDKDGDKIKHLDFLERLINHYPDMIQYMRKCVDFSISSFADEIKDLHKMSDSLPEPYANVRLTPARIKFIIELIKYRKEKTQELLK